MIYESYRIIMYNNHNILTRILLPIPPPPPPISLFLLSQTPFFIHLSLFNSIFIYIQMIFLLEFTNHPPPIDSRQKLSDRKPNMRKKNYCGYLILFIQTHKEKNEKSFHPKSLNPFLPPIWLLCCAFVNFPPLSHARIYIASKKCDIEGYMKKLHIIWEHQTAAISISGVFRMKSHKIIFLLFSFCCSHFHKSAFFLVSMADCDT